MSLGKMDIDLWAIKSVKEFQWGSLYDPYFRVSSRKWEWQLDIETLRLNEKIYLVYFY